MNFWDRFTGSKVVESAASEWLALGGEYQGLLKQLQSKKSATTKFKALQVGLCSFLLGSDSGVVIGGSVGKR